MTPAAVSYEVHKLRSVPSCRQVSVLIAQIEKCTNANGTWLKMTRTKEKCVTWAVGWDEFGA